jgi:cellulose biosynthesis protein BcsQ
LRGEYAEVRRLAATLRDIADSHGVTLRALEARMAYGHSAISMNLSGVKRPEWDFVVSFLRACTGKDGHACEVLKGKVRPLWEAAAPGLARRVAEAPLPVPTELQPWVGALRDAAEAQGVVASLQLSVGRHQALVGGLLEMLSRLTSAKEALEVERDALSARLRDQDDLARELSEVRARLDDTQRRLDAAVGLQGETSRMLGVALGQLEDAEQLKRDAISQAASARKRLAELERYAIAAPIDVREGDLPPGDLAAGLMGEADQEAAETILRHVDDALGAEAANLDGLRSEIGSTGSARREDGGLSADNSPASPDNAGRALPAVPVAGSLTWTARATGRVAEDWPAGIRPEESDEVQPRWEEGVGLGAPFSIRYRADEGTGSFRYFDVSAIPISRRGEITEWSITSTDLTDQQEPGREPGPFPGRGPSSGAAPGAGQHKQGSHVAMNPEGVLLDKARAEQRSGQVITFYSFEGGTGRTMAIANVAWILAANGYRILAADWDLDAPGLNRFFQPFMDARASDRPGIVDLVRFYAWDVIESNIDPKAFRRDESSGNTVPPALSATIDEHIRRLDDYLIPLSWQFPGEGTLHYLSPGKQNNGDYQATLNSLDWDNFYENLAGDRFMTALRTFLKSRYDYILIDSPSGHGDVADICTVHLPDMVVDCFTLTNRGIESAAKMAREIPGHSDREITILPVPMRVEEAEKGKADAVLMFAANRFKGLPPGMSEEARREYWASVQVPYRPFYAFVEELAVFRDQPGSPVSLLSSYERISSRITANAVRALPPREKWLRPGTRLQ